MIDVTEILNDPDLADLFTVIRRIQFVDSSGEVTVQSVTFKNVVGVVTQAGPNDFLRLPDSQFMSQVISIVSKFMLHGPQINGGAQYQPDIVVWRGNNYLINLIDEYPQSGPGFVQALAGQIDSIENAH